MANIAKAPRFVRKFAVGKVEDFAEENGYERITLAVVNEQMDVSGTRKYLGVDDPVVAEDGEGKTKQKKKQGVLQRLLKR